MPWPVVLSQPFPLVLPALTRGATWPWWKLCMSPKAWAPTLLRPIGLLWLLSVQNPNRALPSYALHGTKVLIYVCGWQKGGATNIIAHNVSLVTQSCLTLSNFMDCSRQASLSMGILQARILERVAMPSSRGSSQPRGQTQVFCFAGGFFTDWATREALLRALVKSLWSGGSE